MSESKLDLGVGSCYLCVCALISLLAIDNRDRLPIFTPLMSKIKHIF